MSKLLKFVVIFVAVGLMACAATPTKRTVKEGWKDNLITSKIKWRMGRDDLVHASHMTVETWRGTVTLTGRAVSEAEKAKAEEIARGVKNVKTVRNYIDVVGAAIPVQKVAKEDKPFSKPTGKYTKTQDISLPVVSATPTTSAASATTSTQPSTTPSVTETTIEEPSATTTAFESKAATKSVPELSEAELANAPSTGHENAVSHEIKKELAMTTEETKTQSVDDVTLQAEQELKALKAKKRSK